MGRKLKPREPKKISSNILRRGEKGIKREAVIDYLLYKKIRRRLCLRIRELPNNTISSVINDITEGILDWIVDNPEGFEMPLHMGYLAISKYIMIPYREDRWEIVNKVKNLSKEAIGDRFREIVLKKYSKEITIDEVYKFMKRGRVGLNAVWYNKRNCSIAKAGCYKWSAPNALLERLKKTDRTRFYYLNFQDYYNYKIKPEE